MSKYLQNWRMLMNRNHFIASGASLVVAFLAFTFVFWIPAGAQDKEKVAAPAVKWEYKIVKAESKGRAIDMAKTEDAMNKLGEEGWECVATISDVHGGEPQGIMTDAVLICKRPKR
jgi:hypothetical protein